MNHSIKALPKPYVASSRSPWMREQNAHLEFSAVSGFMKGLCLDVGCGSMRYSETVLSTDVNPDDDVDFIWDIWKDGKFNPYPFKDARFDAIFSSHVIEDEPTDRIQATFDEWMRLVKPGGYLCLLVPDMEGKRYPDVHEKWGDDDDLVKLGERNVGDCKGNSAHRITMGSTVLVQLLTQSKYDCRCAQLNTLPPDQMTMDCVVQKIS